MFAGVIISALLLSVSAQSNVVLMSDSHTSLSPSSEASQVEFRGVIRLPGGTLFSLHDFDAGVAFWIELGRVRHGIEALRFNQETNTLFIRRKGIEHALPLAAQSVQSKEEKPREPRTGVYRLADLDLPELEGLNKAEDLWDEMFVFVERWQTALAKFPQFQAFEKDLIAHIRESSSLFDEMERFERDSNEYERARSKLRDRNPKINTLLAEIEAALKENPIFGPEDVELFKNRSAISLSHGSDMVTISSKAGPHTVTIAWFKRSQDLE